MQGMQGGRIVPPLFLDQTEAQTARKNFLGDHCLPPTHLRVWIRHCIVEWWWQFPAKMSLVHSPIPHLRKISMLNAFLTYKQAGVINVI